MTKEEKEKILHLKNEGYGYKKISTELGLSINTIKSICRRNKEAETVHYCKNCHKEIQDTPGKKHKIFCCDKCRMEWWNSHKSQINKKSNYTLICQHCGKHFISYGNKKQKYCCHACYIAHRYGGDSL